MGKRKHRIQNRFKTHEEFISACAEDPEMIDTFTSAEALKDFVPRVQEIEHKGDSICHDIEVGEVFLGKVVNILPIGAQVELKPGKKGLVHISRLANHRVERVEDEVSVGDELLVRVIAVKPDGKIDLTRKDLLPDAKK